MQEGYVLKNKNENSITAGELELINKFTRRKLNAEEVYVFSVVLCDNDIDREFDRFTDEALLKLSKLFVGKTGITNHEATSENQTARIFFCKIEALPNKLNQIKTQYKRLVARAYMPKSAKNEEFILAIDSGIKKEVSVGCSVAKITCSICEKNKKTEICDHIKGHKYKKNGVSEICYRILDNPTDAYEWSFVAVPAQREAGVIKSFVIDEGGEKNMKKIIEKINPEKELNLTKNENAELFKIIRNLEEKAKIGDVYKNKLKNEVIKLSAVIQPEISLNVMKEITERMSVDELKIFKDAYKTKFSGMFPGKPQLGGIKSENFENIHNTQFKV